MIADFQHICRFSYIYQLNKFFNFPFIFRALQLMMINIWTRDSIMTNISGKKNQLIKSVRFGFFEAEKTE